jgi:hypothetical protein
MAESYFLQTENSILRRNTDHGHRRGHARVSLGLAHELAHSIAALRQGIQFSAWLFIFSGVAQASPEQGPAGMSSIALAGPACNMDYRSAPLPVLWMSGECTAR